MIYTRFHILVNLLNLVKNNLPISLLGVKNHKGHTQSNLHIS